MKVLKAILATFIAVFTVVFGYWLAGIAAIAVSVISFAATVFCGIAGLAVLIFTFWTSDDDDGKKEEDKPRK